MPQARNVELNYNKKDPSKPFGPTPPRIPVAPADVIHFRIGQSTRAEFDGCKLRITLLDNRHFSDKVVQHSDAQTGAEDLTVRVTASSKAELAASAKDNVITAYSCELLDAKGTPIPGMSADGAKGVGGEIEPDSTGN